ncbi:putative enzyme [Desulfosarcina cetonica]|uniref:B12-binding domain-containing radical SAM protein n=1 Tax=Desulfosarcina cetonica TaxID=90730 RepID=UPI0006D1927A|nr:radical SAM protein [Desulfosarcina cetonica]VTR65297.1 putative enzyme [Desulfosarcina cetonica]
MNNCDVLLINCPITFEFHLNVLGDQRYWPPLGLMYLAAMLERKNVKVKIIDPAIEKMVLSEIIQTIDSAKPTVVGLSSLTSSLRTCVQIAKAIRARYGHSIKICIGGSHISADPDFYNRFQLFDVAITGEAEITFTDVAVRFLQGEKIFGIIKGETIKQLDEIPFPARHLVNLEKYQCFLEKEMGIITSRGCPFKCNFCSRPAVSKRYRMRSSDNIVDEMEIWYRKGWKNFYFLDDILTMNRKHVMNLCDEIIHRGLNVKWGSNTRADCVDGELVKKMAAAGCRAMLYGVESGNTRIRNEVIGKGVSEKKILEAIRITNKNNIVSGMFLMMGFPTEGKKELKDTIKFASKADPSVIGVHLTKPMPGAKIYYQAIKEGVIPDNTIDLYAQGEMGEGFVENWPVYIPKGMTKKKLEQYKKIAILLFYFRPRWLFKNAGRYMKNKNLFWFDFNKAISIFLRGQSRESMS